MQAAKGSRLEVFVFPSVPVEEWMDCVIVGENNLHQEGSLFPITAVFWFCDYCVVNGHVQG